MVTPVRSWADDYDIFAAEYVSDPFPIWDELRGSCPIAHSERYGGSWLPTRYEDVAAIAHDVAHFSSRNVSVVVPQTDEIDDDRPNPVPDGLPPITADPPVHTWARRLLLPWFAHTRVAQYEVLTRELCGRLADEIATAKRGDAAAGYAQQIPVRVIAFVLGVPEELSDRFTGWVRDVLEFANVPERRLAGRQALAAYFNELIDERRGGDGDDLITQMLQAEVDGDPVPETHVLGTVILTLIAGVDTTWSGIGSSLWHLATHADDRARLVREPDLMPIAVEELLRAYSPVTMARVVNDDIEIKGCPMHEGDKVLLNFPAANRDPEAFPDADRVIIDRMENRHMAFGLGIHRCAGSNLARMELRVALEEWLARIPEFELEPGAEVTWAGGQVRGPRSIPIVIR